MNKKKQKPFMYFLSYCLVCYFVLFIAFPLHLWASAQAIDGLNTVTLAEDIKKDSLLAQANPPGGETYLDSSFINLLKAMPHQSFVVTLRNGEKHIGKIEPAQDSLEIRLDKEIYYRSTKRINKTVVISFKDIDSIQVAVQTIKKKKKSTAKGNILIIAPIFISCLLLIITN